MRYHLGRDARTDRFALGLRIAISAALGLIVGAVGYFASLYFFPSATWVAWALGILLALGGALGYVDAWIAARWEAQAIGQYLKGQAERKR